MGPNNNNSNSVSSNPANAAASASGNANHGVGSSSSNGTSASPSTGDVPTIRFVPVIHNNNRGLNFPIMERKLPNETVLKVKRYVDKAGADFSDAIAFKSKVVSRQHGEIWSVGKEFYYRDTKSSSGSFINNTRLSESGVESQPVLLRDGDTIQLGVDYQGRSEDIFKCVRMRVELNRPQFFHKDNAFRRKVIKVFRAIAKAHSKENNGSSECCICLSQLSPFQAMFVSPCSHTFHFKCAWPLLENYPNFSCPLCRYYGDLNTSISVDDLTADMSNCSSGDFLEIREARSPSNPRSTSVAPRSPSDNVNQNISVDYYQAENHERNVILADITNARQSINNFQVPPHDIGGGLLGITNNTRQAGGITASVHQQQLAGNFTISGNSMNQSTMHQQQQFQYVQQQHQQYMGQRVSPISPLTAQAPSSAMLGDNAASVHLTLQPSSPPHPPIVHPSGHQQPIFLASPVSAAVVGAVATAAAYHQNYVSQNNRNHYASGNEMIIDTDRGSLHVSSTSSPEAANTRSYCQQVSGALGNLAAAGDSDESAGDVAEENAIINVGVVAAATAAASNNNQQQQQLNHPQLQVYIQNRRMQGVVPSCAGGSSGSGGESDGGGFHDCIDNEEVLFDNQGVCHHGGNTIDQNNSPMRFCRACSGQIVREERSTDIDAIACNSAGYTEIGSQIVSGDIDTSQDIIMDTSNGLGNFASHVIDGTGLHENASSTSGRHSQSGPERSFANNNNAWSL